MNFIKSAFVLAGAIALVACDDSSSASNSFSCDVTRKSGTVKVSSTVPGYGSMTVTVSESTNPNFEGYRVIVSQYTYKNSTMANEECEDWKEEANEWRDGSVSVKCSGSTITVTEYDKGSLDSHEREYKEMCEETREYYESGAMDMDY